MNAIPFDTLKLARGLEDAGMTGATAIGAAEALAEAMGQADLATRSDVAWLRTELKGDVTMLRTEVIGAIGTLRTEFKGDLSTLRAEVTGKIGELKADLTGKIGDLRADLTGKIGDLRGELKSDIAALRIDVTGKLGDQSNAMAAHQISVTADFAAVRASIELLRRDMTIKLGGMIFLAAGLIAAAMRLMPPKL